MFTSKSFYCLIYCYQDAEEVVTNFNGKTFLGAPIVVEFAKEGRSRPRDPYDDRGGGFGLVAYPILVKLERNRFTS